MSRRLLVALAVLVGVACYLRMRHTSISAAPGGGSPEQNTGPG